MEVFPDLELHPGTDAVLFRPRTDPISPASCPTSSRPCGLPDSSTAALVIAALATIRAERGFFHRRISIPFNTAPGERPSASMTEGDLGNTRSGDGALQGRGFVQLTSRAITANSAANWASTWKRRRTWPVPEIAAALLGLYLASRAESLRSDRRGRSASGAQDRQWRQSWPRPLPGCLRPRCQNPGLGCPPRPPEGHRRRSRRRAAVPGASSPRRRPGRPARSCLYAAARDAPRRISRGRRHRALPGRLYPGRIDPRPGPGGACTGFGLACVVNYLRWRKADPGPWIRSARACSTTSPAATTNTPARITKDRLPRRSERAGTSTASASTTGTGPYRRGRQHRPSAGRNGPPAIPWACITASTKVDYRLAGGDPGGRCRLCLGFHPDGWDLPVADPAPPAGHGDVPGIAFDGQPSQEAVTPSPWWASTSAGSSSRIPGARTGARRFRRPHLRRLAGQCHGCLGGGPGVPGSWPAG